MAVNRAQASGVACWPRNLRSPAATPSGICTTPASRRPAEGIDTFSSVTTSISSLDPDLRRDDHRLPALGGSAYEVRHLARGAADWLGLELFDPRRHLGRT